MPEEKEQINIEGYIFNLAKQGLEESQVLEVIRELKGQLEDFRRENNAFKQRENHLESLSRLAEKVVVEADVVAAEIKSEAEKNARELLDSMNKKVQASHRMALMQVKEAANQLNAIVENLGKTADDAGMECISSEKECEEMISELFPPAVQSKGGVEKSLKNIALPIMEVGLEVIPPVDIDCIMMAVRHLEDLEQVQKVELISRVNKPLIIVSLVEAIDVKTELEGLPYIQSVEISNDQHQERPTFIISTNSVDKAAFQKS